MSDPIPDSTAAIALAPTARPVTAFRRFLSKPLAVAAAIVLALVVLVAIFAPLLAPFDPGASSLKDAFGPADGTHLLGFDSAGRDVFSRLIWGAQNTMSGAGIALIVALVLGIPTGLIAGYYGRWFDSASSWIVNLVMSLPAMVVLLASRAILGPTVWVLMIVMGVLVAPSFFRLVRGIVGNVRNELYVDAARVSGLRDWRIIGRHVFIVVRAPIIIQVALVAGVAIGLQAGLEFLGITSGDTPTWGAMLNEAFQNIQRAPLLLLWPGLALGLTSASLVLLASGLSDVLGERGAPAARRRTRKNAASAAVVPSTSVPAPASRGALLSIRDLAVSYELADGSDREVVHGINLDIEPGEILGLVGESGSGKSQTAFSILGILPEGGSVSRGSVTIQGTEVIGLAEKKHRELRGTVVAYVPQEPMSNLDPSFTIGDQLAEPLRVRLGLSKQAAKARVLELLQMVEIADPARTFAAYPHEISGGMAQRVLIAGAMSCDPDLLVADEPTTALDVTVQAEVLSLLRRLRADRGIGVLIVTHNLGVVADLCDRVAVMQQGRIVEQGTTEQILVTPEHPYTRQLLGAALDGVDARPEWQPRSTEVSA
ncbi:dipeptide/oligopeptide/nickel ABC transporter permease/ATP-binding protein [Mycetocola saprophilus]|uniref:dipeptide/oligopeptide/nickel ABC transporter permease/ATP-binding protein n=1 Tax=Mycetocola saprophilus TaxID=76636 RepID=UPI003BF312B9